LLWLEGSMGSITDTEDSYPLTVNGRSAEVDGKATANPTGDGW
jgi:hypothetical protein